MRLPRDKDVLENARALRKSMTREERHLWYDFLRGYSPRFVRQKVVGRYILDFYCDAAGLAIELDGSQHYEAAGQLHDAQRTEYLEGFGIRVLRFSNLDVMQHFEGVCRVIDNAVKSLPRGEVAEGRRVAGSRPMNGVPPGPHPALWRRPPQGRAKVIERGLVNLCQP